MTCSGMNQDGSMIVLSNLYETKLVTIDYEPRIQMKTYMTISKGASSMVIKQQYLILGGYDGLLMIVHVPTQQIQTIKVQDVPQAILHVSMNTSETHVAISTQKHTKIYLLETLKVFIYLPSVHSLYHNLHFPLQE
jgi:hypothetical protein